MKVSVACLGGAGEIGMNMYVYETGDYAVIADCGVKFAENRLFGMDLIIPDFSYIETIKHKRVILIITHVHEDHAGAVPYLLSRFPDITVGAFGYALDFMDYKLKEYGVSAEKINITPFHPLSWGDFSITLIPVSHSIRGTAALIIKTSDGFSFVHISDYKIDFSSEQHEPFPLKAFTEIAAGGVGCLLADSTNILRDGWTESERTVYSSLKELFEKAQGRIFFTTFSSNTERLQSVFNLAEKFGRRVAIEGSSLMKHIKIARKYGKLKTGSDTIIPRKMIERLNDKEVCVIMTGSQGEPLSAASCIARNDYGNINIRRGDLFIFSSRIIPGNERDFGRVINNIYKNGGECVTADINPSIHVSGHASRSDAMLLIKLLSPDYLIPVHGEVRHLISHAEEAVRTGAVSKENALLFFTGDKLVFDDGVLTGRENVPAAQMFVDTATGEIADKDVIKAKKRLAAHGAVIVFIRDFHEKPEAEDIIIDTLGFNIDKEIADILKLSLTYYKESEINDSLTADESLKDFIERTARRFFKKRFGKLPVIKVIFARDNG